MFILDENQQHHLLVILNEINRHIYDSNVQQQHSKNNNQKNAQKNNQNQKKPIELPSPITGFNFNNRQSLIDFIWNTIRYFRIFFKFTSNSGQESQNSPFSKSIVFWLSIFYNKLLFEHINFKQIFDDDNDVNEAGTYQNDKDKDIKSKVVLNGASNSNNDNNNGGINLMGKTSTSILKDPHNAIHVDELVSRMNVLHELNFSTSNPTQIYQQTLSNLNNELTNTNTGQQSNLQLSQLSFQQLQNIPQLSNQLQDHKLAPKDNNVDMFALEQQNPIICQKIKDITFISLLLTVIFYKLRYVFTNIVSSASWKFLVSFERELEISFLHESFSEFLQNELCQQRQANKKRTDHLKQEVIFLEKITKSMDKEVENEIFRLVQLQNRPNNKMMLTSLNTGGANRSTNLLSQQEQQNQQILTNNNSTNEKLSTSNGGNLKTCPECGKAFKNTYKLNRHLYVHKDPSEKPYVCNWERCNYRSISKNDLNRHKMVHTGEKPYVCEIDGCEKRYSRADKLRHHKLMVHFKDLKKELICSWPGCNFQCLTKNELNRHQLTHEAIKCDYIGCEKIFDKVDKYRRHREKDHLKIQVNMNEFSTNTNFTGVPISVTSTPDIATVAAASNQSQQHSNIPQMQTTQQQPQHIMMATNNTTNANAIQMHHTDDLQGHISLNNVVSLETDNNHQQITNQVAASANANSNNNNQVVINTISSVPISVVASNHNNNNNSSNHPNTISVWSS